ncbi:unnamed protein product, partial [Prorocentrum cordatum]
GRAGRGGPHGAARASVAAVHGDGGRLKDAQDVPPPRRRAMVPRGALASVRRAAAAAPTWGRRAAAAAPRGGRGVRPGHDRGRAGRRRQAQADLADVLLASWKLGKRRLEEAVDHSALVAALKDTSFGRHIPTKTWVKAGVAIGISTVTGSLVVLALLRHQLARQTGNITAEATTTALRDEALVAQLQDMIGQSLKEPATREGIRQICVEVLIDPQV